MVDINGANVAGAIIRRTQAVFADKSEVVSHLANLLAKASAVMEGRASDSAARVFSDARPESSIQAEQRALTSLQTGLPALAGLDEHQAAGRLRDALQAVEDFQCEGRVQQLAKNMARSALFDIISGIEGLNPGFAQASKDVGLKVPHPQSRYLGK